MPILKNYSTAKALYTTIPNHLIRGESNSAVTRESPLDLPLVGLLVYLLSHSKDWNISHKQLSKYWKVSPTTITKYMKALEKAGYIKRQNLKVRDGAGWNWIVTDEPFLFEKPETNRNCDFEQTNRICDQRVTNSKTVSNTISKTISNTKTNKNKNISRLEKFYALCPTGCSEKEWIRWIDARETQLKKKSQRLSDRQVQNSIKDWEGLRDSGLKDWAAAVDMAVDRNWQSMKANYTAFESLIKNNQQEKSFWRGMK